MIGLSLALEVKRRHPGSRLCLIEKEPACGLHASGRNSGVLHAGFYYSADSLKARFTRDGNRELTAYCESRGLPINRCGKLVVARGESELAGLDELLRRGKANGVELHEITAADARAIEPRALTHGRALFSPTTSSVDPQAVVASLIRDAQQAGIVIRTGTRYLRKSKGGVATSSGTISTGYVINAAGLYADRIAHDFGFASNYRILPFKGLYLYAPKSQTLRAHLYPVPELQFPFLGVHFTLTAHGRMKIGPTAIPAFWREHYQGLSNFSLAEFIDVLRRESSLFLKSSFDFGGLALRELRKYSRKRLLALANELLSQPLPSKGWTWGKPGIRAQLVDLRERKLEMDFRFEGDDRSLHVLNAVSPAFTCAMPFARLLADRIEGFVGGRGQLGNEVGSTGSVEAAARGSAA